MVGVLKCVLIAVAVGLLRLMLGIDMLMLLTVVFVCCEVVYVVPAGWAAVVAVGLVPAGINENFCASCDVMQFAVNSPANVCADASWQDAVAEIVLGHRLKRMNCAVTCAIFVRQHVVNNRGVEANGMMHMFVYIYVGKTNITK